MVQQFSCLQEEEAAPKGAKRKAPEPAKKVYLVSILHFSLIDYTAILNPAWYTVLLHANPDLLTKLKKLAILTSLPSMSDTSPQTSAVIGFSACLERRVCRLLMKRRKAARCAMII